MIEKERIESIKAGVDLAALVKSKGIDLKKNGKSYHGLCPFHDDTNPSLSINPDKNLWQCFGCGAAGDVIRFVELVDKVAFPEAVKRLSDNGFKSLAPKPRPNKTPALTVKDRKLLARVVGYYQHTLNEDSRGLTYLKQDRGITDNQSLKDFGAGYANGTLLEILPEDPDVIKALKKIGVLNAKGHEVFYNCVVFPLYNARGSIENLYGRNIDEDAGTTHLYLPGPRSGLVNRQAVKRSQTIILTESIIDALTLYDQGFKNVIPIYGVNGLLDEHLSFFNRKVKEVYLVFDADDAGRRAAEAVSLRLKEKGIESYPVALPVKDVNIYFKRHTPEQFETLLKAANPQSIEQSEKVSKREQSLYADTDHGFIVGYGERQYEIKGIQRGDTQLKVTIKASADVAGSMPFELSTIDLYSSRSRIWFAKLCADLFAASEELIKEDIGKILNRVESWKPQKTETRPNEPTAAQKEQALRFLKSEAMFDEILAIEEEMGMGGAAYSIRNIQSSKKITVAATGKDPGTGKMKTEEYTVNGPVAVMITTTAAELEGETASRFLFLTIDESTKMTCAIHRMQREAETLQGLIRQKKSEHIIKKHHNAQRLLRSLAVVNSFTEYLSYPNLSLRTRRDHKKYLGLIRTVTLGKNAVK